MIKKEGELPERLQRMIRYSVNSIQPEVEYTVASLMEAGYTLTEPLIEEVRSDSVEES